MFLFVWYYIHSLWWKWVFAQFAGTNHMYELSLNNRTLWSSFSLFWRNNLYETCFWCLFICSFQFWIITYTQADTGKGPFRSNYSFLVCACTYVMIQNGKMHTNKYQKQNISLGKEKKSFIMFSFWENPMDFPSKIESFAQWHVTKCSGSTIANIWAFKNLYSLFDRNVP